MLNNKFLNTQNNKANSIELKCKVKKIWERPYKAKL